MVVIFYKEVKIMKAFLKSFRNKFADENINLPLAKRELEAPLYEYILDVFESFGQTGFIHLIDWKYIDDESKINISKFNVTRTKKSKMNKDKTNMVNIDYDRVALLWMLFKVEVKGEVMYKDVNLLLPKFDDNNFLYLKGKSVYLIYQMVNESTYVTKNSVTLKGLMPLCINRQTFEVEDTSGTLYKLPTYKILNFNKKFNPIMLFGAKMGFYKALNTFECANFIKVIPIESKEDEGWIYFTIMNESSNKSLKPTKIKVKVAEDLFNKYPYAKAVTAMVIQALSESKKPDLVNIADTDFWLDELGCLYTGDRVTSREIGRSTLIFFERLVDKTNVRTLRLHDYNKRNTYNLTTCIIQNFDAFKSKNNNDINNRRLRLNECISAITSLRMGKSINRILSKGDKVTLDEVLGVLKIAPNLILRLLYKSEIVTFNDIINDLDFFNAYKFSIKGPNAIGGAAGTGKKSDRNITSRDRGVSLSSIGIIDADVCSSSSPGLGGLISPFAKTYGLHFNPNEETQDSVFEMVKESMKYIDTDQPYIEIPNTYDEYIHMKEEWIKDFHNFISFENKDNDVIYVRIGEDFNNESNTYIMY